MISEGRESNLQKSNMDLLDLHNVKTLEFVNVRNFKWFLILMFYFTNYIYDDPL